MTSHGAFIALAVLAFSCDAIAQSGTCMEMGGGMTHCNFTPDMSRPQTNGGNLSLIADLIARSNERSFRKKIGEMLAKGDCSSAAKFAFSKGRIELGSLINSACAPKQGVTANRPIENQNAAPTVGPAPSPLASNLPELENRLRIAAASANAAAPTPLDNMTTATKVEVIGTQILISASVNAAEATLTDVIRTSVVNQICANSSSPELLKAGASIRIKYVERNGKDIGSVMVTKDECGL